MQLFYAPRTRATRPRWLLEELGEPYELVRLDLSAGAHKQAAYLDVNPLGKVPALRVDGVTILESAAICLYLADRFADRGLAPGLQDPARGPYVQWMVYPIGSVEPGLMTVASFGGAAPEGAREEERLAKAKADVAKAMEPVAAALADDRPYLLGEAFSAADVMMGSVLLWTRALGLLGDAPALAAYLSRVRARPAWRRAMAD